jgi:DNA repair photolyase
MKVQEISTQTILNPTSGFLDEGFTHTINLYRGCPLGNSLCGKFCYAQWNRFHTKGRAWGSFLDIKTEFRAAYRRDYDRIKHPRKGQPRPLRIYMSSVTDPYSPWELSLRHTRRLLEEMVERPPDLLVIQSHTPLVTQDLPLLERLQAAGCELQVNITVETDKETLPANFPRHLYPPHKRIAALREVRAAGLTSVGVISPLLPLDDVRRFAETMEAACEQVILDHFLIGDGSKHGLRTHRSGFPQMLVEAGFERWTRLEVLWEVETVFQEVFQDSRRLRISRAGFNAV